MIPMPLTSKEEAKRAKKMIEKLSNEEYQIVEYPKGSSRFYIRKMRPRKPATQAKYIC